MLQKRDKSSAPPTQADLGADFDKGTKPKGGICQISVILRPNSMWNSASLFLFQLNETRKVRGFVLGRYQQRIQAGHERRKAEPVKSSGQVVGLVSAPRACC